jgi:hypothetical protein
MEIILIKVFSFIFHLKINSFEVNSFEVNSFEVNSFEVNSFEVNSFEVNSFEVLFIQISLIRSCSNSFDVNIEFLYFLRQEKKVENKKFK